MKKFKHLLTTIALCAAVAASACWFGENNTSGLEDAYLAYLSGDVKHVEKSGDTITIKNNQTVALPFTVFVKVSPHKANGDEAEGKITKAVLQYKVLDKSATVSSEASSEWITVKSIENPDWDMDFDEPVALFGRDCIDIPNVTEEKEVIIRLHLSDGTHTTGSIENETNEENGFSDIQETITVNGTTSTDNHFTYSNGWTAPFVWKVKVKPNVGNNGTKPSRRPHR